MSKKGKFDINAISIPEFGVTLYNGKQVRVRGMVMKEYRNVLLAKDGSEDPKDHALAVEKVVRDCIIDDLEEGLLTTYDYEYIFIKAFEFSNGVSKVPVLFKCTSPILNEEDGSENPCNTKINTYIDLKKIRPSNGTAVDNQLTKRFIVEDGIVLQLRKPTFVAASTFNLKTASGIITSIVKCFDHIDVHGVLSTVEDIEDGDMDELFNRLKQSTITDMFKYISDMPRVCVDVSMTCPECGAKHKQTLTGIEDFFI